MRFLHIADVHLDTAFRSRSETLRRELREASRAALGRAAAVAIERRVDALLIAGDLFDGEHVSVQTERFLHAILDRLGKAGIAVVYASGNHDPSGPPHLFPHTGWPEHVHFMGTPEPRRIAIHRGGEAVGYVTGAGHPSAHTSDDLSAAFPRPAGALPEVAILHTQVGGARGEEEHHRYAPSDLARLRTSGYDYWALGHVHTRQALSNDPPVHYPGNIQGRTPRETGAKGGLLVELSARGGATVEFVELGAVRWETVRAGGLDQEASASGVARAIERAWERTREPDPGGARTRWVLTAELEGPCPLYRELTRSETVEEIEEAVVASLGLLHVEVRVGAVRPSHQVEDHIGREDVLGEALRWARELARSGGPSPSELLGVTEHDLAGTAPQLPGGLDHYLRELLGRGDVTLLETLLGSDDP